MHVVNSPATFDIILGIIKIYRIMYDGKMMSLM